MNRLAGASAHRYDDFSHLLGLRLLKVVMLFFSFLITVLLYRRVVVGETESFPVFVALYCVGCGIYAIRSRLSGRQIILFLLTLFGSAALTGFAVNGLASGGPYLFFVALLLAGILDTRRARFASLLLLAVPLAAVFALAVAGLYIPLPPDIGVHLSSPSNWLLMGCLLLMTGMLLYLVSGETRRVMVDYQDTLRRGLINAMVAITRHRDNETGAHLERCSQYARALLGAAREAGIRGAAEMNETDLAEAVRLHDIGKVAVPDSILLKPGRLSKEEFDAMSVHASMGGQMIRDFTEKSGLDDEPVLTISEDVARYHHENWDGTGYPEGLSRDDIPLAARIMALIDVYDALRSQRPYKAALSHREALQNMSLLVGTKFDPDLFAAFDKVSVEFARIFEQYEQDHPAS